MKLHARRTLPYAKVLFFSFIGIILALACAEGIMRATGYLVAAPGKSHNQISPADARKLRILAIGESTTADYFSEKGEGAWPRILESMLNSHGIEARVYNKGEIGSSSPFILAKLPQYLDAYDPHIVISMMGVNDNPIVRFASAETSAPWAELKKLRLFKLATWFATVWDAQLSCKIEDYEWNSSMSMNVAVNGGHKLVKASDVRSLETWLRSRLSNEADLANALAGIAGNLFNEKNFVLARTVADRAFALRPYGRLVAFWALSTNAPPNGKASPNCGEISRTLLRCRNNLPDAFLAKISNCFLKFPEAVSSVAYSSRGLELLHQPESQLGYHYRALNSLLKQRGIAHIAMQYPTLPLDTLTGYFRGEDGKIDKSFSDIVFVSNRENFLRAMQEQPYSDFFTDQFAGTWGHTTALGHRMIANSALDGVLQLNGKVSISHK